MKAKYKGVNPNASRASINGKYTIKSLTKL